MAEPVTLLIAVTCTCKVTKDVGALAWRHRFRARRDLPSAAASASRELKVSGCDGSDASERTSFQEGRRA